MKPLLTLAAAILLLPTLHAQLAPTYTNPVIDADFADPAILREPDGTFYAFSTQAGAAHIQVARSPDLVHWTMLGDALPVKPTWASQRHNFWAPDVHRRGDTYVMYFAAEPDTSSTQASNGGGVKGMCLGMATAHTAAGPYTDAGQPVLCGPSFIDIDPMGFDDPKTGKKLLYWGSGFEPLKVQELAEDRLHFVPGTHPTNVIDALPGGGPENYRKLVEGAWTTFHNGWYYVFFSGDNCCGTHAHYAVMVARSRSPFGPFQLKGHHNDGVILHANASWLAPGHNAIATDDAHHDWILYHAIDPSHRDLGRVLLLDRITYRHGWPEINDGSPSHTPVPAPSIQAPPPSRTPLQH